MSELSDKAKLEIVSVRLFHIAKSLEDVVEELRNLEQLVTEKKNERG